MRREKERINEKYSRQLSYIRELYSNEDSLLKNIRSECSMEDRPITINPEEGKFLQFLIKSNNVKNIVEIGTLYGYSTVWMARALPDYGEIYTIDREKYNVETSKKNFKKLENNLDEKIISVHGNAVEKLNEMLEKNMQFDMIFIDADKINYLNYLRFAEKIVKKNGLIVADNTFLSGAVYLDYLPDRVRITAQKNMRQFNRELSDNSKYCSIMFNTEEGLTASLKLF